MKICVRVSTGDECPDGTAAFHTTFFAGPNSEGSPDVFDTPVPLGPRKRDQSGSAAASEAMATSDDAELHFVLPIAHRNFVVRMKIWPSGDRRRAQGVVVELVFGEHLELRSGLEDDRHPVFVGDVDLAVGQHRRPL